LSFYPSWPESGWKEISRLQEEPEICAALEKALNQDGINTRLHSKVTESTIGAQVVMLEENAAGKDLFRAEQSLLATSLDLKTEGPGWEQGGVELTFGGFIKIKQTMQTID